MARAAYTCSRIAALLVPSPGLERSSNGTGGTSMCKSMRSRSGPEMRPMYFSTAIGAHLHGFLGSPRKPCKCAPITVEKYMGRISGPLLDRIDLHIEVP